jgi:hypothetical protein
MFHILRNCTPVVLLGLAALPHPAYAGKVKAQVAPGTDMAQYKTYEWLPTRVLGKTGLLEDDPVMSPLIKDAVNRELTQRGLKEVTKGGDLQISAGVMTHAVPQVEAVWVSAGTQGMYYATPIATIGRYNRKGSLIVNLIDSKTKTSAWAGVAEENLNDMQGAGLKKISDAAGNLFKKYPAKK